MSSGYVRTKVMDFLSSNFPMEKLVDISAEYEEIADVLKDHGIGLRENWLGVQFIANSEGPVTVPATNSTGKYREFGSIILHVVEPSMLAVINKIVTRADALRKGFRGQRIENLIIETITPLNTAAGSTLSFQRGFSSGSIIIGYQSDEDL